MTIVTEQTYEEYALIGETRYATATKVCRDLGITKPTLLYWMKNKGCPGFQIGVRHHHVRRLGPHATTSKGASSKGGLERQRREMSTEVDG